VCVDTTEEDLLVGGTGDVDRVRRAVALLGRGADARGDSEAQEEAGDIVSEPATGRGVVDATAAARGVGQDGSVRRPEVTEEECDLLLGQAEHFSRNSEHRSTSGRHHFVVAPHVELDLGCRHVTRSRDAVAWLEFTQAAPAVIGQERMVGGQLDDAAAGGRELEDLLASGREDVSHDLRDVAQ